MMKCSLKSRSFWKLSVVVLALATGVSACNDDETVLPIDENAKIGVVNLLNDGTGVDVHLDQSKLNTDVSIEPGAFSNYFSVKGGVKKISLFESGQADTLANVNYDFKAEQTFSVFAVGSKEESELVVFSDDIREAAAGKAKVRFANFVSNEEATLGLWLEEAESALVDAVAYKTTKNFVEIDAIEDAVLQVKVSGSEAVIAQLEDVKLDAGAIYTVYVIEEDVDGISTPVVKVIPNLSRVGMD